MAVALIGASIPGRAVELVLPQSRNAVYSAEEIELAVAGLADGEKADVELAPVGSGRTATALQVEGDGSTVTIRLPGLSLAPGKALIEFAWSPFAVEKNALFIGASDDEGLRRGAETLIALAE